MSDRDPIRIQRENRVVKNIETSLKLYHDVLGFDIDSVKDLPNSSYAYDLFDIPRGASIRTARLSSKSQLRVLALTEYTERRGGSRDLRPRALCWRSMMWTVSSPVRAIWGSL